MATSYIDISPTISEKLRVFPGDVAFQRRVSLDLDKGDNLTLHSSIQTTLHLGAHADGPNHYAPGLEGIDSRNLAIYMGRCLVLHAEAERGVRIERKHLAAKWQATQDWGASRILVRSLSFPDPDIWNEDFNSLSPKLIEDWATSGVRLVGIDTPSIDPQTARILESHSVIARHDMAILEGIVLRQVPEGYYTLIALPLKILGADAAPVRAILLPNPDLLER